MWFKKILIVSGKNYKNIYPGLIVCKEFPCVFSGLRSKNIEAKFKHVNDRWCIDSGEYIFGGYYKSLNF
jgi:hypothetical protein